jgi:hypothetical protein
MQSYDNQEIQNKYIFKIARNSYLTPVFGDKQVGKTSIITQLINEDINYKYLDDYLV